MSVPIKGSNLCCILVLGRFGWNDWDLTGDYYVNFDSKNKRNSKYR